MLLLGVAACAPDHSTGAGEGTLHVSITGLNAAAPNAGKVTITPAAGDPQTYTIPTGGDFTGPVLAGTYGVAYELPAKHRLVPGTSVPTSVTIEAGKTQDVAVQLQALGNLSVAVTGFDGAQPNGGTAVATPSGGGTGIPVTLNTQGSGSVTDVVVGGYSVAYTAPTGYHLVTAGSSPASVTVPFAGTGNASFNVAVDAGPPPPPPPPPPSVVFHSDWSTALGSTSSALLDSSKTKPWTLSGGQGLDVIASTGLDFPTANVLRVTAVAATTGFGVVQAQALGVPAIGTSVWYRWYGRMAFPDNLPDNNTHPVQDDTVPGGGGRNWELNVEMNPGTAGKWQPTWRLDALDNGNDYDWIMNGLLDKNVTYRFELQVKRTGTTTFEIHTRIYNSAGTLIKSDADFHNFFNTKTLANSPSLTIHNAAGFDDLNVGNNGISGTNPPFPFVYAYWGAVAISTVDWIGPYSNGI